MLWKKAALSLGLAASFVALPAASASHRSAGSRNVARPLNGAVITAQRYGNDAGWYLHNVPLLEIDDPVLEDTYYYRWEVYRSHIRELGPEGVGVTEFLPNVSWSRHPYEDLNDSSPFHITEGRWLRDPRIVASLIDHLYAGGGNDRHFSEWTAAAVLGWTQVTGDTATAVRNLDAMLYVYNAWNDHFDSQRNLYWVEPLLDATEYTVASIDASGAGFTSGKASNDSGFTGGFAFRPSINSYQYGNARAIATFATIAGRNDTADSFTRKADTLRDATLAQLWNPQLQYFGDVYQRSTKYVNAGDRIRNRELVGLVPWQFGLASTQSPYQAAWSNLFASHSLAGAFGLRTTEPTYPRYLTQYRYDEPTGLPECQWNGPSWPFQTSEALTGLANLLHNEPASGVTYAQYVHLLRQYAAQHRLPAGNLDIVEDYDPDKGGPIVKLPRSHHYLHSTFNDLLLSGLVGVRPQSSGRIIVEPLLPEPEGSERQIRYFAVQDLPYHGHALTILYDKDGTRYHQGSGLILFVDGSRVGSDPKGRHLAAEVSLAKRAAPPLARDWAVNLWAHSPSTYERDLPIASASSTAPGTSLYEPLDGKLWFTSEVPHGWSPERDQSGDIWFGVDLRQVRTIHAVEFSFADRDGSLAAPARATLQVAAGEVWHNVPGSAVAVVRNGPTRTEIPPLRTQRVRILLPKSLSGEQMRLLSLRVY